MRKRCLYKSHSFASGFPPIDPYLGHKTVVLSQDSGQRQQWGVAPGRDFSVTVLGGGYPQDKGYVIVCIEKIYIHNKHCVYMCILSGSKWCKLVWSQITSLVCEADTASKIERSTRSQTGPLIQRTVLCQLFMIHMHEWDDGKLWKNPFNSSQPLHLLGTFIIYHISYIIYNYLWYMWQAYVNMIYCHLSPFLVFIPLHSTLEFCFLLHLGSPCVIWVFVFILVLVFVLLFPPQLVVVGTKTGEWARKNKDNPQSILSG